MSKERNDSGRYTEKATLEDVLAVFDAVDGPPVVTSADVADGTGISRDSARRKLEQLRDEDRVSKRKSAGRVLYWRTDDASDGQERRETSAEEQGSVDPLPANIESERREETPATNKTPQPSDAEQDPVKMAITSENQALVNDLREYLEATDQPPKTAHGRGVILDVFRLLREHGTVSTGDLQGWVYPEYTEHWGSERTMWNAIDRYLEDIPGIEKAGYGEWGYAGDESVQNALNDVQTDSGVYDPTEEF